MRPISWWGLLTTFLLGSSPGPFVVKGQGKANSRPRLTPQPLTPSLSAPSYLPQATVDKGTLARLGGPVHHDALSELRLLILPHMVRAVQGVQEPCGSQKSHENGGRCYSPPIPSASRIIPVYMASSLGHSQASLTCKLQVLMFGEEGFSQVPMREGESQEVPLRGCPPQPSQLREGSYSRPYWGHSRYCRIRASCTHACPLLPTPLNSPSTVLGRGKRKREMGLRNL